MTVKELIEVLDEELESKEIYIFDDYVSDWRIRCLSLKEKCKIPLYLY